ncbi:MAG: hypothetical protein HYY04_15070 [Chloroflexi bacterium]|nr:hypothetical protein [Chloroflexota bacterium]
MKLIHYLRELGFAGPYPGGNHEFMTRARLRVIIPNPHQSAISRSLLLQLLREATIPREEWEAL